MKYSETNKPIVCMQTNSTCYKGTRTQTPVGVLWHSTGANNKKISRYVQPLETDDNYQEMIALLGDNKYDNDWNHIEHQAGLNAWIGELADGTVATVQSMPWNYRAWGCGSGPKGSCNDGWIQFEICEDNLKNKEYFEAVYEEACELTAYLCTMFNFNPKGLVTYKGQEIPVILCHADSYQYGVGNNHGDILHWFTKYGITMEDIRNRVASLMDLPVIETKTIYRVRKSWEDVASQKGAFTELSGAQKCCDEAGPEYEVYNETGEAIYPERNETIIIETPKETAKPFEIGEAVRISTDAIWTNGKKVASWVPTTKMYIRGYKSDTVVLISTLTSGAITGTLDIKYVSKYIPMTSPQTKPSFKSYIIKVLANSLNVRAGAGTKYKVNTVIKKNELYTIVDEKDGWGKLKSGAGWISLAYTQKIK